MSTETTSRDAAGRTPEQAARHERVIAQANLRDAEIALSRTKPGTKKHAERLAIVETMKAAL